MLPYTWAMGLEKLGTLAVGLGNSGRGGCKFWVEKIHETSQ